MNIRLLSCLSLSCLGWMTTTDALSAPADTPTSPLQAQFGGQCPQGLAEGRHVMTDCSVTWKDPEGGLYCFKSAETRAVFLKDSTGNLARAREFVAAIRKIVEA